MNLSKEIANWVKNDAPFLNRSAVCRAAKIDRSNFDKFIKMGAVPEKHIALLSQVLCKYGFKPTLEKGVYDDRTNPLINAARGRDESGINKDEIRPPKTLQELKDLCPQELTGLERSQWIANKRQEYGL